MRSCRSFLFLLALLLSLNSGRAGSAQEFVVGGFVFGVPKGWAMAESTSVMRKAELRAVADKGGGQADTVFFCFGPGQGGNVADNVARWKGQMSGLSSEKVEEKEIAGTRVTLVKLAGTYQSGMPGGPKLPQAGTMLLGAILEGSQGDVFVKMTGPSDWVEKIEKEFAAMIEAGAKNKKE